MCGIAGVLTGTGAPPTWDELAAMAGALEHRGPDERGAYLSTEIGLAHTRLSIIDLSAGQQPMTNDDGSLTIVFNGEIFNYVELADELRALGRTFRTRSDTEVLLQAFDEWGDAAFTRFNGQFAVGIWNARTHELTLARDPFGVRPLYVAAAADGRVYFASEVKAIFAAAPPSALPRAIDPLALQATFTFWSVLAPRSMFVGVEELCPGFVRTYGRDGMREHAHFELAYPRSPDEEFAGTLDDAAEAVRAALDAATALRLLRADVPVGSYLSGGLDSSLVAALAARRAGGQLTTFSLRFADAEYDETIWQRQMVERLGSRHAEIVVDRTMIARAFSEVVRATERPILRTAPAPLFLLSGLVREHGIKVVLTGEGADEMFAGYDLFREAKVRRFWARQPSSTLRPRLLERLYPYLQRSPTAARAMARQFFGRDLDRPNAPEFAHAPRWHAAMALQRLFSPSLRAAIGAHDPIAALVAELPPELQQWAPLARDQYLEIRTLMSSYILSSQGDRMLMAHSIEGRFPFLDRNVAALAARLPAAYKLAVLDEKHVLKRAARGLVPDEILTRKKQPYRAPDALSFVDANWVDALLAPDRLSAAALFEPAAIGALWSKVKRRRGEDNLNFSNADNMALTGVISTQLLHEQFVATARAKPAAIHWTTRLGNA